MRGSVYIIVKRSCARQRKQQKCCWQSKLLPPAFGCSVYRQALNITPPPFRQRLNSKSSLKNASVTALLPFFVRFHMALGKATFITRLGPAEHPPNLSITLHLVTRIASGPGALHIKTVLFQPLSLVSAFPSSNATEIAVYAAISAPWDGADNNKSTGS